MFKPMCSLFWHHITDYWWRCLAAVVLIVIFASARFWTDFPLVSQVMFSCLGLNLAFALLVPFPAFKAFGYRRADFLRVNIPLAVLVVAVIAVFNIGVIPLPQALGITGLVALFVVWYLYTQIRDKDRERKRTADKDSKGARWKVTLSTAVIVGGLLFAWQKLLPGVFPSVRDPFIWAIPILFGAVGSSWLFGDSLYMWQAFGRTRRSWRRHNLGTGLLGLVCVLALSGLLAPADLFVNVGLYVLFFVLCNATLWLLLVGSMVGPGLLGIIQGLEISQPTGAIVCVGCIVLALPVHYFYPLYANTQRIPEWSK